MTSAPELPATPESKLALECDKLRAEIKVLNRSQWRNLATLLGGVAVVATVAGTVIQYEKSNRAYELAVIERARAQLDLQQLAVDRQNAKTALQADLETALAINGVRVAVQGRLAVARSELVRADSSLAHLPEAQRAATADARRAVASAAAQIHAVTQSNAQEAQEIQQRVNQIKGQMTLAAYRDTVPAWLSIAKRRYKSGALGDWAFDRIPRVGDVVCTGIGGDVPYYKFDEVPRRGRIGSGRGMYPPFVLLRVLQIDSMAIPFDANDNDPSIVSMELFARVKEIAHGDIDTGCPPMPANSRR